jgi:hypothetical protein
MPPKQPSGTEEISEKSTIYQQSVPLVPVVPVFQTYGTEFSLNDTPAPAAHQGVPPQREGSPDTPVTQPRSERPADGEDDDGETPKWTVPDDDFTLR